MSRTTAATSTSSTHQAESACLPQIDPSLRELVVEQVRSYPEGRILDIAEEVFSLIEQRFDVHKLFHAFDGEIVTQGRLYEELVQEQRWEDVESLLRAHQVKPLVENAEILTKLFASASPEVGQIMANELVIQSFPLQGSPHKLNRSALDEALRMIPAEYLIGLSEEGVYTLRERFGLNHVAQNRFDSIEAVLQKAASELKTMTGNPELGRQLIDQMLTYPRSRFEKETKKRHGLNVKPFNPSKLSTDLEGVLQVLNGWSKTRYPDPLPDNTRDTMLQTLEGNDSYKELPETFKETVRRELRHGPERLKRVLTTQRNAEIIGDRAEQKARELLAGMSGIVAGVYFSCKFSDADMMGRDLAVLLFDGRTVYLDIKASDAAATLAKDKRVEFANHSGLSPQLTFVKNLRNESAPGQVYRNSLIVVVDPRDDDDARNKANLLNALMPPD